MNKKFLIIATAILAAVLLAYGVTKYPQIKASSAGMIEKITAKARKIPLIGKYFAPKGAEEEKKEEEKPQEAEKQPEIIEVRAFKTPRINFADVLPIIGTVNGSLKVKMRFEINGTLANFNFREGDLIEEGDIIAELDHTDAQLKVKFREAKLEAARTRMLANKKKLEQHQQLLNIGAIIRAKLEEVDLEYQNALKEMDAAQVELDSAKLELEKTYLKSPIDGVLETKDVEVGEYLTSSVQAAVIGLISEVYVEMGVIEKDVERIQLGQTVKIKVDTFPDEEFIGEIDNIFPTIEGKTRTLTIRAKIANEDNKLLPGMFARAWITVFEKQDAVVIPPTCADKTEDGYRVCAIDTENVVHPKPIEVEYTGSTEYWVISSGLEADEVIVNEVVGTQLSQLQEGAKVEVIETEEYTM